MKKRFNTAGICIPQFHYMMDNRVQLKQIMKLIEYGEYFNINRPRQFGKTTTLYFLAEALRKSEIYLPIELNLQGIDSRWHESDMAFAQMFADQLIKALKYDSPNLFTFLKELRPNIQDMNALSDAITDFMHQADQKLVLLIDEVDVSSNYEPFLNFLGMLRTKYLGRMKPNQTTFYSIVLAGVHDIKSLKYKRRNPKDAQNNSPWNIAASFKVDMRFNSKEIAPMLEEYGEAEGVTMDIPAIAERLHYHTSGYPFLVSKLCKTIAEDILPKRDNTSDFNRNWTLDDVEESVQLLLTEENTNFDSLIKNLENHKDLYDLVFRIVMEGDKIVYNPDNATIKKGVLYGVFKRNGNIKIHNRVYEQRIYNYMASNVATKIHADNYNFENQFLLPNKELDLQKILLKFQQFMQEQYSDKDQPFLEREWRLIFLAFIKPIIIGGGHDFKEVQISAEKRLDIVITYFQHKYIVELKRWNGDKLHQEGIQQLSDYLTRQNKQKGYLVIFEYRTKKTWRKETILYEDKEIYAVWM